MKDKDKDSNAKPMQSDITMTNIQKQFMLVAVRIRPMLDKEISMSNIEIVKTSEGSNGIISIVNPLEYQQTLKGTYYLQNQKNIEITKSKEYQFSFDQTFNTDSTQEDLYTYSSFLLRNALDGFNSTILAYGTTGTGKTYSMVGNGSNPGVMVRTISDLFNIIADNNSKSYTVQISYIEIYNEVLSDLLADNNIINNHLNKESSSSIEIRNDPSKGVILVGAISKNVQTASEAYTLLIKGNKKRREDNTNQNDNSSRSHAILQILLEQKSNNSNSNGNSNQEDNALVGLFGKYVLVDLAGSEKVSKQTTESGSINKSLLALTNCINAIINNKAGSFVPWRDSKLTRILKDALNGNSRVLMLTTISPSVLSLEETLYTLQFASRAKNVKIKVKKNEVAGSYHIGKYDVAIQALQKEIAEMKSKIAEKSYELNNNALDQLPDNQMDSSANSQELEVQYIEMKNHFEDEVQLKKRIIDKEKEAADFKLAITQLKNQKLFQDPNTTKQKTKDIEDKEKKLTMITNQINDLYTNQATLVQKRKLFQKLIEKIVKEEESKKDNGTYLYSLSFMNSYKYHIALLKSMSSEARNYVDTIELKLKDEQISVLTTQLEYRDNVIVKVNQLINNGPIKDSRVLSFVSPEEIKLDPCPLPRIKKITRNTSYDQFNAINAGNGNSVDNNLNHESKTQREQSLGTQGSVTKPIIVKEFKSNSLARRLGSSSPSNHFKSKPNPKVRIYKKVYQENTPIKSKWITSNKLNPLLNNKYLPFLNKVKYQSSNNSMNNSFSQNDIRSEAAMTNTSKLEREVKKNVKTILRKDIIGRYKNSPYSFADMNK